MLFSSIWFIDKTLSGSTYPGQRRFVSHNNKEVLHIPQSSSITWASLVDSSVSYPGHSLGSLTRLERCRDPDIDWIVSIIWFHNPRNQISTFKIVSREEAKWLDKICYLWFCSSDSLMRSEIYRKWIKVCVNSRKEDFICVICPS